MAYGTKYITGTHLLKGCEQDNDTEIKVIIEKQDYTGDVTELLSSFDTYRLNRDYADLEDNILGVSFEFEVIEKPCDNPDFFALMDLMRATERQFRIRIEVWIFKIKEYTLFEGYLNVESSQRKYLPYQPVHLVASSYLSKLENYHTSELDTIQDTTFIDYISSMLRELGSDHDIRVNCTLLPTEDWVAQDRTPGQPGFTLFNKTACTSELFFKNNIEKETSYKVLQDIMDSFNCYIYWWNDHWYIERYKDFWTDTGTKEFVEYNINNQYSPSDAGVWVSEERLIQDVHDLPFSNMTQTIFSIPGMRIIAITINDKQYDNLVPPIFTPYDLVTDTTPDFLQVRRWALHDDVVGQIEWSDIDKPYSDIENAIKKHFNFPNDYIAPDVGMYCDFRITIKDETEITISWKHALGIWYDPEVWTNEVQLSYAVRLLDQAGNIYVYKDIQDETKGWYLQPAGIPEAGNIPIDKLQSDYNQETNTIQLSVTIPLNAINEDYPPPEPYPVPMPFRGDYKLQLTIGRVQYHYYKDNFDSGWLNEYIGHFGDVDVKVQGNELDDNYIEGTQNTDFLNKKDLTVTLADQSDLTYMNGIIRGSTLYARTIDWKDSAGSTPTPLIDLLLKDKFRFYNVVREKIQSNIFTPFVFWKPIMLFQDSKQSDMKFVLMGSQHRINTNAYDVILIEYDNETVVNLNG